MSFHMFDLMAEGDDAEKDVSVDPHWIDMERVNSWIRLCQNEHSGVCHSITDKWRKIDPPKELFLVNVERKCLECQGPSCQYIALSYVWGDHHNPFMTVQQNLPLLYKEGAFDEPEIRERLPQTIQDSMLLTRKLGQRYLWCDRLSIIQDDEEIKSRQLEAMASIYANAYLTIVAADGEDDTFGIRGISRDSGVPRMSPFQQFNFSSDCRLVTKINPELTKYDSRGWTFQEYFLSHRKLEFHAGTVSWTCRRTKRDENIVKPINLPLPLATMSHNDIFTPWPNLNYYRELVVSYSKRDLTFPSDAFNAFSAIIAIASRSMVGGVLFGLPEMFFDGCLLWQPRLPLRSRQDDDGYALAQFPSWSWLGWFGFIDTDLWMEMHPFTTKEGAWPAFLTLFPTIEWYKHNLGTNSIERISNTYYQHSKAQAYDINVGLQDDVLPEGWHFRHPVPIPKSPLAPKFESWSPILQFRTRRLSLYLGERYQDQCAAGYLQDEEGRVVGGIRLNSDTYPSGEKCELISISRAEAHRERAGRLLNYWFPEYNGIYSDSQSPGEASTADDGLYRFHNVLWIHWDDGIAYRVALGRVEQKFWESANTEEIEIRLG